MSEDVGLLAYSPLACGLLSGKYLDGIPKGSRLDINKDLGGRWGEPAQAAVRAYVALAAEHGLDPSQMALAWTLTRPFMTSSIFGATSMEQLETALGASEVTLSDEVMDGIAVIHRAHPMPF